MIRLWGRLAVIATMASVAACASVMSGTSQTLTLDTVPSGADCSLSRKGLVIGHVNPTPGAIYVQRTHDDITVTCAREGYQTGSFLNKSGLEAATFGNIILGGLVGVFIDAASGANNKYDEKVRIVLAPTDDTQRASAVPEGALAAVIEFHCPGANTVIRNSTGARLTFTESNGLRCAYFDETGQQRERYALFADGHGRLARHELDALWPLKVGNSVSFDLTDGNAVQPADKYRNPSYKENFTVTGQQRIEVPAGIFDTFVVEWREKGIGSTSGAEALITLWYAPAVGYVVKSSVSMVETGSAGPYPDIYSDSRYSGLTFDATEITMPNGQPVPVAATSPAPRATPTTSSVTQPGPAATPEERLRTLERLRDQHLITPEEYETRKKAILNSL